MKAHTTQIAASGVATIPIGGATKIIMIETMRVATAMPLASLARRGSGPDQEMSPYR